MRTIETPLSLDEIKRFFQARIQNGSLCPRCGEDAWSYPQEDEAGRILGLCIMGERNSLSGIYATFVLDCTNCGFVSPHAKNVIVKWLNEVEEKIAHLPGKGFIVATIILALAVITGLLAIQSRIQAFVGNDTAPAAQMTVR